jgi:phosphatidylserine/phosphatidylglycerophosphate/cardiolipin synthase-like enzyme
MFEDEEIKYAPDKHGTKKLTFTSKLIIVVLISLVALQYVNSFIAEPDTLPEGGYGIQVTTDYDVRPLFNETYKEVLIEKINRARKEIFVAMYMIQPQSLLEEEWPFWREDSVMEILEALIAAQKRGVEVLVILSRPLGTNKHKTVSNEVSRDYLIENGVTVEYNASPVSLHDKIVVIDHRHIFQGSHNWTPAGFTYNHEQSLLMTAENPEGDKIWNNYKDFLQQGRYY